MSYALFFYSYALTLLTAAVFVGFGALYIRRKKRLHLLVTLLFGLYLIDIMFLWMVEFIPEFAGLFQDMQTGHPFVYTLFNTLIILTYRAILGDLLDHPISNVEAAFWLLCFVGIIAEWSIKNDLYRVAADLIFPYTLQIWTIVSAFWIYARQRDVVERSRGRAAIFFAIVYSTCEILEIISTSNTLRSIFFEALGLIYTVSGAIYLWRRVRENRQQVLNMQPLAFAQEHDLTRREGEILKLLLEHKTNREIGEELCISTGTVKTHVRHIYEKIGVTSREELYDAAASTAVPPVL
ncbi:helix-turn-helix transcriptional regulator [Collinsella provencensis]|uniref:helix-turn-helix transcriptional regulator n=1 Tax=Collinsella provencensis TaxID=1937461 RepID=UPI00131A70E5|nr:helix-turn-helix transcriptional regulator [Collinsella provencensis]